MKQILVATDFSACAGNALEYALGVAKVLNIQVCVIHAIGSNEGVDNNIFNAIYIKEYYNKKREALSLWVSTFTNKEEHHDINVVTACEIGGVVSVLTKYIDANPVELIVMGTMGSTGISGLFGSNTNNMVIKTKTPILLVPLESKFMPNPVITLATDFSADLSAEDINALNELILAFKLEKLNVVNVIEGTGWKVNETGENRLRALLSHTEVEFKYINESNPTEGIINFIASNETDILCLVKHHHNILYRLFSKSTVNQVMSRAIKAVLVLHE